MAQEVGGKISLANTAQSRSYGRQHFGMRNLPAALKPFIAELHEIFVFQEFSVDRSKRFFQLAPVIVFRRLAGVFVEQLPAGALSPLRWRQPMGVKQTMIGIPAVGLGLESDHLPGLVMAA